MSNKLPCCTDCLKMSVLEQNVEKSITELNQFMRQLKLLSTSQHLTYGYHVTSCIFLLQSMLGSCNEWLNDCRHNFAKLVRLSLIKLKHVCPECVIILKASLRPHQSDHCDAHIHTCISITFILMSVNSNSAIIDTQKNCWLITQSLN